MKFKMTKTSNLSGDTEVTFTDVSPEASPLPFKVYASKKGIRFEGTSGYIWDLSALEDFASLISSAWQEHEKLLKSQIEITKNLPN